MKMHLLLIVVFACLVAACSQPPPPPVAKPDLAAEEKAIRDVDAQWLKAVQDRNAEASAAVFAGDGVSYRTHLEPAVGPAAIQAANAKDMAENPKMVWTWTTDSIQIAESGEIAAQTGQYHFSAMGPKGNGEDKGRFVTVWKKVGGQWKVAHDIGSTTIPEVPPAKKH
jgi:uncharacterized protein (TIGR02246 family)